jgi:predicted alpha/beta-hydrolase family hydrolase
MIAETTELKFTATPEKGTVSAILLRPDDAKALLVFGHGAGTQMHHLFIAAVAEAFADTGIATFRYNYPYSEVGRGLDGEKVRLSTVRAAVEAASQATSDLPLFARDHSMSGRMTSMAQAHQPLADVLGTVFLVFPLYQGQPSTIRAEHLANVDLPMLFVSGDRDALAVLNYLHPVVGGLGERATLKVIKGGDHSFKFLKRSGRTREDALPDIAQAVAEWIDRILASSAR